MTALLEQTERPDQFAIYEQAQAGLTEVELPDFRRWSGSALIEFWFGLRYPRKIRRLIDRVYSGVCTRVIWVGPRGGSKCLGLATPILMYDGSVKSVQEVREGDLLMGPDSLPRRVLYTTNGYGPLYLVQPMKGEPYIVNDAHVLSAKVSGADGVPKATRRSQPHGAVVNIPVQEYAALSKSHQSHLPGWRTGVDFPEKDVPLDPYFLGLWLGDGSGRCPHVTTADPEIVDYLHTLAARNALDIKCDRKPNNKAATYRLTSGNRGGRHAKHRNAVLDGLRQAGQAAYDPKRRRNYDKHIPELYRCNSRQVRLEVLAGLIDSDGTLHHGGYVISATSPILAADIAYLSRSLGYAAYITQAESTIKSLGFTGRFSRVSISGDLSEVPVKIPRKKAPPRKQIKDVLRTGLTVTPCGDGEYFGFEVDGDHLFMLGDFTVTHNSMTDSLLEFLLWFFKDYDVVNVGGSETQAANVYAYLQGFMQQYRDAYDELVQPGSPMEGQVAPLDLLKETMSRTVRPVDPRQLSSHHPTLLDENGDPVVVVGPVMAKDSKAFVAVLAASQKQVRGPHAGSEKRGGALIIDEEAEVAADISTASRYMVNTANPSVIIRTSTNHNAVGTFAEDLEDPDAKGLEKYVTSIFDICKTCPYAKTTPEQWQAIEEGTARAPGDDHKTVMYLPVMQPDCSACPRPETFRDRRERIDTQTGLVKDVKSPLCGGAAAFAENGWIPFDGPGGVLAQYDESPSIEEFEVELCASSPSVSGLVIKDRAALERCIVDDGLCVYLPPEKGGGECVGMIDWGMAGTCAVMLLQNRLDLNGYAGRRVLLEIIDLGKQSDTVVYDQMEVWRLEYGMQEIWADSSHIYCNTNLAARGFHVTPVKFAQQKGLGVGAINGHIETGALWIPRVLGKVLIKQLKGWRRNDTGQIVKKDDHFPDSLLCGLLKYYNMVQTTVGAQRQGQRREAGAVNAGATSQQPALENAIRDAATPSESHEATRRRRVVQGGLSQGGAGPRLGSQFAGGVPGRQIGRTSATGGIPRATSMPMAVPLPVPVSAGEYTANPEYTGPPDSEPQPKEAMMDKLMREAREAADRSRRKE